MTELRRTLAGTLHVIGGESLLRLAYGATGVAISIVVREAAMTLAFLLRRRECPAVARPESGQTGHPGGSPRSEESLVPSFIENVKGNF